MYVLSSEQATWLCRRAFQSAPQEACGFILRCGTIVEIRNIANDANKEFKMCPSDALKKLGDQALSNVVALWHTHPSGSERPSKGDIQAVKDGRVQSDWAYLIVTKESVTQYEPATLCET